MITSAELRQCVHYDPDTGQLTWIISKGRAHVGDEAGYRTKRGYRSVEINGIAYQAHRLAWLYMTGEWPPADIDHINHNISDNRWANLRSATKVQNMRNRKMHANNKSGYKGVNWTPESRKWRATTRIENKTVHLGYFNTAEEAAAAYNTFTRNSFQEFYHEVGTV